MDTFTHTLSPPEPTLVILQELNDRLTALEQRLEPLSQLSQQLPNLLGMMGDIADNKMRQLEASGVHLTERLEAISELTEKLTRNQTLSQFSSLLDLSQQVPGAISMLADILDSYAREMQSRGIDLEKSLTQGLAGVLRLTSLLTPEKLEGLTSLLDDDLIELLSSLRQGIHQSKAEPRRVTAFGLLPLLGDPDVQRSLGFLSILAKQLGQSFERRTP